MNEQENFKARIMAFISKNPNLNCTSRYDISNGSNIQVLEISSSIENFIIFNIYNGKSQDEIQEYTIEQKSTSINIFEKAIIREELNAHHSW